MKKKKKKRKEPKSDGTVDALKKLREAVLRVEWVDGQIKRRKQEKKNE